MFMDARTHARTTREQNAYGTVLTTDLHYFFYPDTVPPIQIGATWWTYDN